MDYSPATESMVIKREKGRLFVTTVYIVSSLTVCIGGEKRGRPLTLDYHPGGDDSMRVYGKVPSMSSNYHIVPRIVGPAGLSMAQMAITKASASSGEQPRISVKVGSLCLEALFDLRCFG